jgi:toxin YoeB
MVKWSLIYTKQSQKDAEKLASRGLKLHAEKLLALITGNPFETPHPLKNWSATSAKPIRGE